MKPILYDAFMREGLGRGIAPRMVEQIRRVPYFTNLAILRTVNEMLREWWPRSKDKKE